jgi:hypothetical protein
VCSKEYPCPYLNKRNIFGEYSSYYYGYTRYFAVNNNRDRVLSYTEEFSKKYGYTPTTFQISNELYIPHDKVSSIIEALRAEGAIQISRPLS